VDLKLIFSLSVFKFMVVADKCEVVLMQPEGLFRF
jgi:hypothetical protein